jgi:hypothetical protein
MGERDMRATIMACTLLLALGGCGQGAPEGGGNSAAAAVRTYTTPDGRSEVRSGDAALSGLPEGIPPYPRADARGAIQFGGVSDEAEMRAMGFRTADAPAAVIAFYAEAGRRAGFREGRRASMGRSEVLGLERDNGDVMNVTATATAGATQVQILAGTGQRRGR